MPKRKKEKTGKRREAYEERVVLFLDFLGFREIVASTENDPIALRRVLDAIDVIKELADETEFYKTQRITQFSDSLVVSYAVHERSSVFELVYDLAFILIRLVELGFLVRGAVTAGPLLHTEAYVVGPAMVEAYFLESQKAIYPRVIVAESALEYARKFPSEIHDPDDEARYVSDFLRVDEDGYRYLDYVSWQKVVAVVGGDPYDYSYYLAKLYGLLKLGLASTHVGVLEKYVWLHHQFDEACKVIDEVQVGSRFWEENEEVIADILAMPRLQREAEKARAAIKSKRAQEDQERKLLEEYRKKQS